MEQRRNGPCSVSVGPVGPMTLLGVVLARGTIGKGIRIGGLWYGGDG